MPSRRSPDGRAARHRALRIGERLAAPKATNPPQEAEQTAMGYLVTLTDFTPSPRADGIAWTTARIEEASLIGGTFTAIQTVTLSPADTDPAHPLTRTFTTTAATLDSGWYRIVWLDSLSNQQATDPVLNARFRPSVSDVAAFLQARTRVNGAEQGTFTTETRPTANDVERLIDRATQQIVATVSLDPAAFTDGLAPVGADAILREAISMRAALLIEGSYFPEQINSDASPFAQYTAVGTGINASLTALVDSFQAHLL
jgi:hypothetical protein